MFLMTLGWSVQNPNYTKKIGYDKQNKTENAFQRMTRRKNFLTITLTNLLIYSIYIEIISSTKTRFFLDFLDYETYSRGQKKLHRFVGQSIHTRHTHGLHRYSRCAGKRSVKKRLKKTTFRLIPERRLTRKV